jgi:hypothetical protein
MSPASNAARNATIKSSPCGAQYHSPVTSRAAAFEFQCKVQRAPIHLRPRQGFGNAFPILLVIEVLAFRHCSARLRNAKPPCTALAPGSSAASWRRRNVCPHRQQRGDSAVAPLPAESEPHP